MDEQRVKLAARLYECRDTARFLFRENYAEKMRGWHDIIRAAMKKYGCSAILTPLRIAKAAEADGRKLSGETILMLSAAAVDVTEQGDG